MSPGFLDDSLLREKVTADIFRLAGIPAARTAFWRVFIDFGEGPRYAGLYTMVEAVEDTMIRDQFGESGGNIYKPESRFEWFVQAGFPKKNNRELEDYSDVRAMIDALHSPRRLSDPARWRAGLEAVFNVDHFLKWLAVNNAIVNWDSYGTMAQNYYLYAHSTKKLTWIPWDHNYALTTRPMGIHQVPGPLGLSLGMEEVGLGWPLIRHLIDDPVYRERYRTHLRSFYERVFVQSSMDALIDRHHRLIAPYVTGPDGERPGHTMLSSSGAFAAGARELKEHVGARRALIRAYLE
jgi:spore coat protein H